MRGRSRVTIQKNTRSSLQGVEGHDHNEDLMSKAKWYRQIAGQHTRLVNKLISTAIRINAKHGEIGKNELNK